VQILAEAEDLPKTANIKTQLISLWTAPVFGLVLLIAWVLCIIKASQGNAFKLPLIGNFAAEQSGYRI